MTQDGTAKDDIKVPEGDIGKQITDDFEAGKDLLVTIIAAMGEEQVSILFIFLGIRRDLIAVYRQFPLRKLPRDLDYLPWLFFFYHFFMSRFHYIVSSLVPCPPYLSFSCCAIHVT